jgi:hypothetical protein
MSVRVRLCKCETRELAGVFIRYGSKHRKIRDASPVLVMLVTLRYIYIYMYIHYFLQVHENLVLQCSTVMSSLYT